MDLPDRQLLDAAPDAMVVVNDLGSIVLVNRQTETLFGYTRDELLDQPVEVLIPERYSARHPQHWQEFFRHLQVRPMGEGQDLFGRHKDGTEFPVEISLSPVVSEHGTFVASAIRDATAHKTIEKSLTGILEKSHNETYIFDANTLHFVQVNEGARRNLGYDMAELCGLSPVDIKPEFTKDTFDELIEPLRNNSQEKLTFETVHQRKDGSIYPVEVHLQLSKMQLGSTPVFAAIVLDTTERKRAETALRESHEVLEQRVTERTSELADTVEKLREAKTFSDKLISTLQGIVLLLDSTGKITHWNPYLEELTGYLAADVLGRDWFDTCIPKEDRESLRSFFLEVMRSGLNQGYTNTIVLRDGDRRVIEWYSKTLNGVDGETVGMLCTGHDVTEREATAAALEKAKEEADRANAGKSRFLAAASHDLRQPLQSIGLYLSVLNRRSEKPEIRELTDKIRNSLDVVGELLDALLDISRLDSGSITPKPRDFNIDELMQRIFTDNVQQADAKGLTLTCSNTDCMVHSDPGLLERVIENFVTNAIRYTEKGKVSIDCQRRGDIAHISVTDSGIGIAESDLDNVFEEYYQLDNPVRNRNKGLGLGLSIVKHIARLLDHPLDVESVPGNGSTFAVDVPLGKPIEKATAVQASVKKTTNSDREAVVLLIDDDPSIVDATSMLLGVCGFQVHSALNGEAALAHLEDGVRPDVVVSDFRLPGLNGVEVTRRVRQQTIDEIPAVLMTGDTSTGEIDVANLTNCTVLHKPVDTDQLVSLIEKLTASAPS